MLSVSSHVSVRLRIAALAVALMSACALCAAAPAIAHAAPIAWISFTGTSGVTLSAHEGIDNQSAIVVDGGELDPAGNVVYLPASASTTLHYQVAFADGRSVAPASTEPTVVRRPVSDQALATISEGRISDDGQSVTASDGSVIPLSDLVEEVVVTDSTEARPQADTQNTIQVTSTQPGDVDLTGLTASTDDNGIEYYHLVFDDGAGSTCHVFVYRSASIAAMFIDTNGEEADIEADKSYRCTEASMGLVEADGTPSFDGALAEMKGRGNSSWTFDKKSFQIKLNEKKELVDGAGKAKTWVLLANVMDESKLRNDTTFSLADSVGLAFTPKGRFVDLYIDRQYRGVYYLCEKVQVGSKRVDIVDLDEQNELANESDIGQLPNTLITDTAYTPFSAVSAVCYTPSLTSPSNISGGYLLEMELSNRITEDDCYFATSPGDTGKQKTYFTLKVPEKASTEEMVYVSTFMQDLQDAIYSDTGYNAKGKHFSEYIDIDSFARYYAVQEMMANYDAFASSTFFYLDASDNGSPGKLYAGPVWDFDHSTASTRSFDLPPERAGEVFVGIDARQSNYGDPALWRNWIQELLAQPAFSATVRDVFNETGGVKDTVNDLVGTGIDATSTRISAATSMDNVRWSVQKGLIGNTPSSPYSILSDNQQNIRDLGDAGASAQTVKSFLSARVAAFAVDTRIGAYSLPANYHTVSVDPALDGIVEVTTSYFAEGSYAVVRVLDGQQANPVIEYTDPQTGAVVTATPAAESDDPTLLNFPMPKTDVVVKPAVIPSFTIDPISVQAYTGSPVRPVPVVRDSDTGDVVPAGDYLVDYRNNVATGKALVTVTGIGAHAGALGYATFQIERVALWNRLAGESRYDTAEAISSEGFDPATTQVAILATAANFPDALAANALAGTFDAPVILTESSTLSPQAAAEINRLGVTRVVIIGGTSAVSKKAQNAVSALPKVTDVERLSGENRMETSLAIFNRWTMDEWGDTVIVASGATFPDALSVSPYAYAKDAPIILTDPATSMLTDDEVAAIEAAGFDHLIIVGGTQAVSAKVEKQLASISDRQRLAGASRYETSEAIAQWATAQPGALNVATVGVATGRNFPDALAGAALCGSRQGVLLLADDEAPAGMTCVDGILHDRRRDVYQGYMFGGDAAVTPKLESALRAATNTL